MKSAEIYHTHILAHRKKLTSEQNLVVGTSFIHALFRFYFSLVQLQSTFNCFRHSFYMNTVLLWSTVDSVLPCSYVLFCLYFCVGCMPGLLKLFYKKCVCVCVPIYLPIYVPMYVCPYAPM